MSKQYTITLQAANTAAPATAITPIAQGGQQVIIKGAKGQNYQLIETATGKGPREIIARKKGQHLEITFEGGNPATPDLIIEQYYDDLGAKLLGEAENGKLYHYIPTSNETAAAIPNLSELAQASQVLGGESLLAPFYLPLAAGAGAAAAGAGFLLPALAALGAGAVLFKSDDTAPAAAALVVKTAGVGDTVKSIAQAIDPEIGVATVIAAIGTTTVVTLKGKKGTVTKTLTGTGAAQAVTLSPEDLKALGDGDVTVTTVTTDKATGQTVPPQVISPDDFTLNTAAPSVKAQGLGDPVKTPAAATGPEGVATVTAEQGAITVVTLKGINGTITKTLIGTGAAQPVVLTPEDIAALGAGPVVVTATTTNPNLPANDPNRSIDTLTGAQADFTIDTAAPNVSAQGLGDYTKTAASATDLAGVASINAPTGTTTVVTLVGPNGTITKTLTGTGAAQPVVLTPADLATLGTGTVIVTAITTDKATGKTTTTLSGPQADFTIDTAAPIVSAKGLGDTNKTAAEATDPAGVASVKAPAGTNTIVTLVGQKGTITIDLGTSTGTAQAVTLTPEQLKILGEGMVVVTAVTTDKATGKTTTTLSGPQADFNIDTVVNTPSVTPAVDGSGKPTGAVTIAPPADTDLTKLTISFKDETGAPQTLIATKDPVTGKWSLPAGTPATVATINPDTGVVSMPADATKDGEPVTVVVQDQAGNQSPAASAKPDEAPKAAVITPSTDPALKGQVTVTPPTTAAESDLTSMTVAYTDEAGNPQTITLNKAPDGTWSPAAALPPGVTLDTNTGVLVMGPDVTKDGSTVTVTTIDNANQSTPVTGTAGDEAPKAAVITPSADPALKGQVTVTPPTTAAESDLKSMTVAYTDEAGNPQTITLNKAPDGTWSAAAALPPGVTLDTSTGALVMGPDVTKDGSTVTVTTIDNANQSTPVTGTAGDEAPKAAVITPSADPALKGQVTVTPPTTAAESDLTSMTVAYTDEAGNPQTITLNKAPDGTWSAAALPPGVTLDTSTGALVMGPDVTQDGSTVTVTTKDAAGQTTVATGPAGDEAPKAAVITPDATVIGQVTVTPPTTAAESDLTSMTVAYTDEAGKPQTITLNKAADGTWSAAAAIPTGVTLDTSTGALVMGPDVTQDGSTVTVTTKDAAGQTTVATGPAGDEKPLAGAVSVPATGADAGKTLVTPPTSAAESDLASMDITFTNEAGTEVTVTATKTAGVWSLPASAPSGMSIDPGTGVVSMLPDVTQDGSTVTVTTKDAAGQTTVATGPAGDEKPLAGVVSVPTTGADAGKTLVTPPTSAAESDLASMDITFTNEAGTEVTVTATKTAGVWSLPASAPSGMSIDPGTGVVSMLPDVTQDGSTVTVTTKDAAGQTTVATGPAGDEKPLAGVVSVPTTGADAGKTLVTPPTSAAESDLASMDITFTNEAGTEVTVTATKTAGVWSLPASAPSGMSIDPGTGVVSMLPDVTQDGSTVTVTTKDAAGQTTVATGPAGDEKPLAGVVSVPTTGADAGKTLVTPPTSAAESDLASMDITFTAEGATATTTVTATKTAGVWSLPASAPSGMSIDPGTGVVSMGPDVTQDGSTVTVTTKDAAGQTTVATGPAGDEAPPPPTVSVDNTTNVVTIAPPTGDPDLATVTIKFKDETSADKTIIATKTGSTWSMKYADGTDVPSTVGSIATNGAVTLLADATLDSNPVKAIASGAVSGNNSTEATANTVADPAVSGHVAPTIALASTDTIFSSLATTKTNVFNDWVEIQNYGLNQIGNSTVLVESTTPNNSTNPKEYGERAVTYNGVNQNITGFLLANPIGAGVDETVVLKTTFNSTDQVKHLKVVWDAQNAMVSTSDYETITFKINGVSHTIDAGKLTMPADGDVIIVDGTKITADPTGSNGTVGATYIIESTDVVTSFEVTVVDTDQSAPHYGLVMEVYAKTAADILVNNNPGQTISSLVTGTDGNGDGAVIGFAITDAKANNLGHWEYQASGTSAWTDVPSTTNSTQALFLKPADLVRWVSDNPLDTRHTSMSIAAVDDTVSGSPTTGSIVDTSVNGGATAFSAPVTIAGEHGFIVIDSNKNGKADLRTDSTANDRWFSFSSDSGQNDTILLYNEGGRYDGLFNGSSTTAVAYHGFDQVTTGSNVKNNVFDSLKGLITETTSSGGEGGSTTVYNFDTGALAGWQDLNNDRMVNAGEVTFVTHTYGILGDVRNMGNRGTLPGGFANNVNPNPNADTYTSNTPGFQYVEIDGFFYDPNFNELKMFGVNMVNSVI